MPYLLTASRGSSQSLLRVTGVVAGLILLAGCSAEKGDWQKAQTANTADAYRQYVEQHPESAFAAEARKKWEALDFAAAESAGTADALGAFLRTHPAGANADGARSKRNMLRHGFSIDVQPVRQVKKLQAVFQGDWYVKDPDKNTGVIFRAKFHLTKEPFPMGLHDIGLAYMHEGEKRVVGCSGANVTGEDGRPGGLWVFQDPEQNQSFNMELKKGMDDWSLVFALPQAATSLVIIFKDDDLSRTFEMAEFTAEEKKPE